MVNSAQKSLTKYVTVAVTVRIILKIDWIDTESKYVELNAEMCCELIRKWICRHRIKKKIKNKNLFVLFFFVFSFFSIFIWITTTTFFDEKIKRNEGGEGGGLQNGNCMWYYCLKLTNNQQTKSIANVKYHNQLMAFGQMTVCITVMFNVYLRFVPNEYVIACNAIIIIILFFFFLFAVFPLIKCAQCKIIIC